MYRYHRLWIRYGWGPTIHCLLRETKTPLPPVSSADFLRAKPGCYTSCTHAQRTIMKPDKSTGSKCHTTCSNIAPRKRIRVQQRTPLLAPRRRPTTSFGAVGLRLIFFSTSTVHASLSRVCVFRASTAPSFRVRIVSYFHSNMSGDLFGKGERALL